MSFLRTLGNVRPSRVIRFVTCNSPFFSCVVLYATNRCNARCKICGIWKQQPKIDLPLEVIEDILKSKRVKRGYTSLVLSGGEFILHPKHGEIIPMCQEHGLIVSLFSNGVDADKVIDVVRQFKIKVLALSLDGYPSTVKLVRGVDCYQNIMTIIKELKDETKIEINYTINPWNTRQDFIHVLEITKENNLNLGVDIYEDVKLFSTEFAGRESFYDVSDLMEPGLNRKFVAFYGKWLGGARIPCLSIRYDSYIMPNGDVALCHGTNVVLGNLFEKSFQDIWKSPETRRALKHFTACNGCYCYCHRMWDLDILGRARFVPKFILRKFFGEGDYDLLRGGELT